MRKIAILLVLAATVYKYFERQTFDEVLFVKIENGLIKGLKSDDGSYCMFLGIPYALVNESNPFGVSLN